MLKCCTQYVSKFGNLSNAHKTGKGQFSFQRMFKLPYNCTHFTRQQGNAQNPSTQVLVVCELRTFRCTSWVQKKAEQSEIKLSTFTGSQRKQGNSRKTSTSASLTMLKPLTVWITTHCGKFLKEMGRSDHFTCLLRNLYVS